MDIQNHLLPWWLSGGDDCDHVGRCRWDRRRLAGSVGRRGLQQALLLAGHRDLQSPPHGEGGEVQQQQLAAAPQAPGKRHTAGFNRSGEAPPPSPERLERQRNALTLLGTLFGWTAVPRAERSPPFLLSSDRQDASPCPHNWFLLLQRSRCLQEHAVVSV